MGYGVVAVIGGVLVIASLFAWGRRKPTGARVALSVAVIVATLVAEWFVYELREALPDYDRHELEVIVH